MHGVYWRRSTQLIHHPLGYLPSPHCAFQSHAAHDIGRSMRLGSKTQGVPVYPLVINTFLHNASRRTRRAMHASCESPWHFSAKRHILGACFSRMAPFRTRFSPCNMAYTTYVQRLIGRLYPLWYCYIPTCRFTAQKDFVDGRIVNSRFPVGVLRHGQALPLHPGVEDPQDEVKNAMIAQFALWTALGHRQVWQDKCGELAFGELDRNRCRCRRWCGGAHHAMASWEE